MINFKKAASLLLKKPNPQEFIRTLDTDDDLFVKCVFDNSNNQTYIIHPDLWEYLAPDITVFQLYPYVNRDQQVALWPIKATLQASRRDTWITSAHQIADQALNHWLRVIPNQSKRRYGPIIVDGVLPFDSSFFGYSNQEILELINEDL